MSSPGRLQSGIMFVLFCLLVMVHLLSCNATSRQDAFLSRLDRIDAQIHSGEDQDALKQLVRLRKKASSARQWLSLAKRERQLSAHEQAVDTLADALIGLPANETLAAVMTDTLIILGRYEEAVDYARSLLSSPYMSVAARAGMERLVAAGPEVPLDPAFFSAAYRVSDNSGYLAIAAVLHAQRGEYPEACTFILADQDSEYRYLAALLCYDAGYYEKVRSLYPGQTDTGMYTAEELLLLSDSQYRLGSVDEARTIWLHVLSEYPRFSPIPYFNCARTSSPPGSETHLLSDCLDIFPSFFPAVALYTNAVRTAPELLPEDPVTGALRTAGFSSTIMDAHSRVEHPDPEEASRKLSRALSDPSGANDPRLHIERIRLTPYLNERTERTEAMVWNLLEQFPDSGIAYDYALWYFLSSGAYDTAFSLNTAHPEGPQSLYSAFESALLGEADRAVGYFMEMANDENLAWLGLANAALIHCRKGDKETALDELILASSMVPDRKTESRIQYRIAVILESMRLVDRAESVLGYALDLDPENHLARAMLKNIRAVR